MKFFKSMRSLAARNIMVMACALVVSEFALGMNFGPPKLSVQLTDQQRAATEKLHVAIIQRNLKALKEALYEGAYLGPREKLGDSSLLHAIGRLNYESVDVAIVRALLEMPGINIEERSGLRRYSAFFALIDFIVRGGSRYDYKQPLSPIQKELINLLLMHGADPGTGGSSSDPDVYHLIEGALGVENAISEAEVDFGRQLKKVIEEGRAAYFEYLRKQRATTAQELASVAKFPAGVGRIVTGYLSDVPEVSQQEQKVETAQGASAAAAPEEDDVEMEKETSMSEVDEGSI